MSMLMTFLSINPFFFSKMITLIVSRPGMNAYNFDNSEASWEEIKKLVTELDMMRKIAFFRGQRSSAVFLPECRSEQQNHIGK